MQLLRRDCASSDVVYAATCNTKLPLVAAGLAAGGVAAGALRPSSNASARAPSSVRVSGLAAGLGSGLGSAWRQAWGPAGTAAPRPTSPAWCRRAALAAGPSSRAAAPRPPAAALGWFPWDPPARRSRAPGPRLRGRHGRRDLRLAYLGLERRVAFRHLDGDVVRNRNRLGIEHHGQHDDGRQDQRARACQPAPRTAAQLRRLHFAGHGRPFEDCAWSAGSLRLKTHGREFLAAPFGGRRGGLPPPCR